VGHTVEWSTANIIDHSNLPLSSRKDYIESMAVLFERLFANEPLDTSVHMWWILSVTHGTAGIGIENAVLLPFALAMHPYPGQKFR